jgi:hypothetical protein
MTRREQRRQQMREQIEERSSQRRRLADQNEPADINAPRAKIRPEQAGKYAGEQHKQQLKAVDQQLAQEQAKHRERLAKLTRIRELAQQQGDTETVGKVDKLLEQDRQRYEAKTQRIERRKNAITEMMKKADANKP